MIRSNEEENLLKKLQTGRLDGRVGKSLSFGAGSTTWFEIIDGVPIQFRKGPGGKFFNGKENERFEGTIRVVKKFKTDDEKLAFLQKYGWLADDKEVIDYSKKFKP